VNGLTLAAVVADRLTEQIPGRTVYLGAVPDGTLPDQYLFVYGAEGDEWSSRAVRTVNVQRPVVWVMSVSRNNRPDIAAREAQWGAAKAREALRNWRPVEDGLPLAHEVSRPAIRNEAIPATTFYAAEMFSYRSTTNQSDEES